MENEPNYQLTLDDIEKQKILESQSGRTAYIDESGNFGFDFTQDNVSKYYILCAVIVENQYLSTLHSKVETIKKNNGFANTEMKSSLIGSNDNREPELYHNLFQ